MENDVVAGRATLWRAEERDERCVAKNETSRRESDDAVEGTSMRRTSRVEGKGNAIVGTQEKKTGHGEGGRAGEDGSRKKD